MTPFLSRAAVQSRSAPVHQRPPGSLDDETVGFAPGNVWVLPEGWWLCRRASAGKAAWQRQKPLPLPGDIVSGAAAIYGIRKLVATYPGPGVQITRASDNATLDIGFLPSGGLDYAAVDRFLLGTSGRITTWYDQSANARHATAGTNPAPMATPEDFFGTDRGALFDNFVTTNGGAKIKNALQLPAGLALTSNALSVISLASLPHVTRNSPIVEFAPANGQTAGLCYGNTLQNGVASSCAFRYGVHPSAAWKWLPNYRAPMNAAVTGFSSAASGVTFWGEDLATANTGSNTTAIAGTALAGGLIGGTSLFLDGNSDPDFGYNVQGALIIYGRAISAAEYASVMASLYVHHRLCPQARDTIVVDGDSLSEGAFAADFQSWPRRLLKSSPRPVRMFNVAVSGGTWASQAQANQIARWVPQVFRANRPSIQLIAAAGSNDLNGAGGTPGYANTMKDVSVPAYLAAVRAAGWVGDILLATIMPRGNLSGQKETERQAYNAALRSAAFQSRNKLAGLSDVAGDPTMGAAGMPADPLLSTDQTHHTDLGQSFIAFAHGEALLPRLAA